MTQITWDDVAEGQEISIVEEMPSQRLVIWAAASGDFYQIHYDPDFAKGTGLDGIIVHGALKNAFLGQLLHAVGAQRDGTQGRQGEALGVEMHRRPHA